MPKISIFAGVAALFLIGVGALAAVGTWTSTSALAGSTVDPLAIMMSATGLTYFVVSLGIAKIRVKWERVSADQLADGDLPARDVHRLRADSSRQLQVR